MQEEWRGRGAGRRALQAAACLESIWSDGIRRVSLEGRAKYWPRSYIACGKPPQTDATDRTGALSIVFMFSRPKSRDFFSEKVVASESSSVSDREGSSCVSRRDVVCWFWWDALVRSRTPRRSGCPKRHRPQATRTPRPFSVSFSSRSNMSAGGTDAKFFSMYPVCCLCDLICLARTWR
jgi:hypothetical protein